MKLRVHSIGQHLHKEPYDVLQSFNVRPDRHSPSRAPHWSIGDSGPTGFWTHAGPPSPSGANRMPGTWSTHFTEIETPGIAPALPAAREAWEAIPELENSIHMRRNLSFGDEPLSPARQQEHDRARRSGFYGTGDSSPVNIGHAEICNDDRKRLVACPRRKERINAGQPPAAVVTL